MAIPGCVTSHALTLPFVNLSPSGSAQVLWYGSIDIVKPGQRVVLVDDLLATGGTMAAACSLVERLGGVVAQILFVVELAGFRARETTLAGRPVRTLLVYEGK